MTSREDFEARVKAWPNYQPEMTARDSRYPDYYRNSIVQAAWEGWRMHAAALDQAAAIEGYRQVGPC